MVSAKQMENISKGLSPKIWQEHKVGQFQFFWQWIVARSSLGENIYVDILSRPVDKDSNCTELCSVFVVPLTIPL